MANIEYKVLFFLNETLYINLKYVFTCPSPYCFHFLWFTWYLHLIIELCPLDINLILSCIGRRNSLNYASKVVKRSTFGLHFFKLDIQLFLPVAFEMLCFHDSIILREIENNASRLTLKKGCIYMLSLCFILCIRCSHFGDQWRISLHGINK